MAVINEAKKTVKGANKKGNATKELKKAIAEPIIAKSITVDANGIDIRQLSEKDLDQIKYDLLCNNQLYHKYHQASLNNIELCLFAIVEKLYGEDAEKVIDKIVDRQMKALNKVIKPEEIKKA